MGRRQKGGEMKPFQLFVALILFVTTAVALASEVEITISETCKAKGDVRLFMHGHLDKITQEQALQLLERDWEQDWKHIEGIRWASYVDMQRIVRDAYREGPIPQEEAEMDTVREMVMCMKQGF